MGRVGANSVNNEKPNHNHQPQVASHQSTPLEPMVHVSEPQPEPFAQVSQPSQQEHNGTGVPQICIQPQIYVQPQIQVPQVTYVQQPAPDYPMYPSQPPPVCPPHQPEWTTGLFDCMDDPENAIITLCCPCVTFGQVANITDYGRTSCESAGCIYTGIALCIAIPCIYSCTYRTKLRNRFGLYETPASDCITHLCCEYCALCQEYRELNNRGFNPSAGWMNTNLQQQGMVPPAYQTMR